MDVPARGTSPTLGTRTGRPRSAWSGTEEPFGHEELRQLYRDHAEYVERFNRRLDELIGQGWLLAEDAEDLRNEAEKAEVPELRARGLR